MMKQIQVLCLLMVATFAAQAQQVPRRVVAEHFTNSYCSICAGRNPDLYQTLSQFPQVLHLAIYPSAPYPACPVNQYDKPEQDARTNYYGVYGSTPRLLVQGTEVTSFTNASAFQSQLAATSSFEARITIGLLNATTGEARLVITKKDASTLDSLSLYAALAYDTLNFTAHNGEQHHYDVFRKSVWGSSPARIALPNMVGDSVVYTKAFSVNADWISNHIYATAILQKTDKSVEQAARSNALQLPSNPTAVTTVQQVADVVFYPNPAADKLYINAPFATLVSIYDLQGRLLISQALKGNEPVDVGALSGGYYLLRVQSALAATTRSFVKQ